MNPPAADDAPVVAGYQLRSLIGRGALGEVHRAVHVATGAEVALKLVRLDEAAAERRRRFALEAAAARRLVHPDIVRVLDAGADGGLGWIAMELLAGGDLARFTRPATLLPVPDVVRVVERVAGALAHAHRHGVVHRDVKPANVVVDLESDRVTLTDFGIANLADGERTRTGLVLGTPSYMAPEQLAGAEAGAAGDLYALGVMAFELLSARLPHEAATLGQLLRRVATDPAPDLLALRPELPPALAALVAALLAKHPASRPPSADAVAAALRPLRAANGGAPPAAGGAKSRR